MFAAVTAGSLGLVALVSSPALAPLPSRPAVSPRLLSPVVCVETEVASALANLDSTTLGAGAAAVLALGGAAFAAGQKKDAKAVASPPPSAAPPSPPVAAPPPAPKAVEKWPKRGGSGGPHRMSGTWPKEPPRELYWPPLGGSTGYHRMAGRKLPVDKPKVALVSPLPTDYKFVPKTQTLPRDVMEDMKALFTGKPREWPQRGGGGGYHRMAGRPGSPAVKTVAAAPAPAAAPEVAAPAAASAGVKSWYDAGVPMK